MNKFKFQHHLFLISFILLAVIPAYKLKSRLGVNILSERHGPELVEEWTGGLIEAKWINRNYIRRPQIP